MRTDGSCGLLVAVVSRTMAGATAPFVALAKASGQAHHYPEFNVDEVLDICGRSLHQDFVPQHSNDISARLLL